MKKTKRKKIIIILVCVAVVAALTAVIVYRTTRLSNESYANCSCGDVNGDGLIDSGDTLLIIQSISDEDLLFENQKLHADVNLDGVVDSADALLLLRYSVGEIKYIPYVGSEDSGPEKKAENTRDDLVSTVQIVNEWDNEDGTRSYQLNVNVKNDGEETASGWALNITLNRPSELDKKWSCDASCEKYLLSVSGEDIPSGSAAACGVIVVCDNVEPLGISEIKMINAQ